MNHKGYALSLHRRGNSKGQSTHEKKLNTLNKTGSANLKALSYHFTLTQMTKIIKPDSTKWW